MVSTTNQNSIVKAFITVAAIFIIFAGIKTAANILVPFLLSIFIAIICNPLINKASQYKIPKSVSVIFVIVVFVTMAVLVTGLVGSSLNELSQHIPQYRVQLKAQFSWLTDFFLAMTLSYLQLSSRNILILQQRWD